MVAETKDRSSRLEGVVGHVCFKPWRRWRSGRRGTRRERGGELAWRGRMDARRLQCLRGATRRLGGTWRAGRRRGGVGGFTSITLGARGGRRQGSWLLCRARLG